MCEWKNNFSHQLKVYIPKKVRTDREYASIDICMIDVLKYLWKNNIVTLGHCCGHKGKFSKNPSIIISENYKKNEVQKIYKLIKDIDNRKFEIYQWQLIKIKE